MKSLMSPRSIAIATGLIVLGVVADQVTKIWAAALLPGNPIEVIPGAFTLQYVENRSAAFGLGAFVPEHLRRWLLLALTLGLSATLFWAMLRSPDLASRLGFGITVSGALGNIVDRIRLGYVIDFLYWHGGFRWPNFNVSDILICTGVGVLIVFGGRKPPEAASAGTTPSGPGAPPPT